MKEKVHAHPVPLEHTPKTKEQAHAPRVPQESIQVLVKAHVTNVLQVPTQTQELIHAQTVTTDKSQSPAPAHVLLVLSENTLRQGGNNANPVHQDIMPQALEPEIVPPVTQDTPQMQARAHAQSAAQEPTPRLDPHNVMIATQDISQEMELEAVPLVQLDNTQVSEKPHAQTVTQEHTPISKVPLPVWTANQENSQD